MNKNKSQNAGEDFPLTDELILAAGVLLYFLYRVAFGGGIPQRERQWAIQLYSVASMALAAEASGSLSFFSFVAAELLSRDLLLLLRSRDPLLLSLRSLESLRRPLLLRSREPLLLSRRSLKSLRLLSPEFPLFKLLSLSSSGL